MNTVIRPANLDTDRGLLIEAHRHWLAPQSDARRFDWLYRNSPHGQARAWLATLGNGGSLIGAAAAFPRRLRVGGVAATGWVLGDFFVVPQYRSLGPAVQLQRACLGGVDSKSAQFYYDFPAAAMLPVYSRLAVKPTARLVRFAKPLRLNSSRISKHIKPSFLVRGLTAVGNFTLESLDRRPPQSDACTISVQEGPCGAEFTELSAAASARHGICIERSAEYLNWRYRNHFCRQYEILTARRDGKLLCFAVFTRDSENAEITDLFGDESSLWELLTHTLSHLRRLGVLTVSAPMLDSHRYAAQLARLGFRPRESCPVITNALVADSGKAHLDSGTLFLMQGDRES